MFQILQKPVQTLNLHMKSFSYKIQVLELRIISEAQWHNGMSSASGSGDPSSNISMGDNFFDEKEYLFY